jgi:hypothetical protein
MGLRLYYLQLLLGSILSAPLRYFERRTAAKRQHELALVAAQAEAQAKVFGAIAQANLETVRELAGPLQQNAKVLTTWLEGFKTEKIPTSQVITEVTELGWEADEAEHVLEKRRQEDAEMLRQAWPTDGRLPPPIAPDFFN